MARHVQVTPLFYARLALLCSVDQQLEIIGRRLPDVETTLTRHWDTCHPVPGRSPNWRFLAIVLDNGTLAAIYARQTTDDPDTIEIRNITVTRGPSDVVG